MDRIIGTLCFNTGCDPTVQSHLYQPAAVQNLPSCSGCGHLVCGCVGAGGSGEGG